MAEPEPVSVRDLEVADRIARAVRGGRPADRRPTLEQLVAAFGEAEPTRGCAPSRGAGARPRRRGDGARPARGAAGPAGRCSRSVTCAGAGRCCWAAAGADRAVRRRHRRSPPRSTSATTTPRPTCPRPPPRPPHRRPHTVTQERRDPGDVHDDGGRQGDAHERRAPPRAPGPPARERRRSGARGHAGKARAPGPRRAGGASPCASTPAAATFLCVEGDGKELFNGTLSGARTFRGRVVRLNVGLGPSTRVTANGRAVPLTASPTGARADAQAARRCRSAAGLRSAAAARQPPRYRPTPPARRAHLFARLHRPPAHARRHRRPTPGD